MRRIFYCFLVILISSCSYKFNGASIPPEMKTLSVPVFENVAQLVDPYLSNNLTEDFKTRIRTQSKLSITQNEADAKFEGKITDYDVKPTAIQNNANPVAGANRLTITVQVKYTNLIKGNEKQSFDESFTAFTDFTTSSQPFAQQQQVLNKRVIDQLTENIFNRAFAQW
ncbi:MAG: hypothetical protein EOO90_02385 [Pedobacter sp.]|nr:MAG: hypothetical protein EOO90_02385 [Pedobacter sp.]